MLDALNRRGDRVEQAPDAGPAARAAVHSPEYLAFLETAHARWVKLPDASSAVIPNVHRGPDMLSYPTSVVGQAGYHMSDTGMSHRRGNLGRRQGRLRLRRRGGAGRGVGRGTCRLCSLPSARTPCRPRHGGRLLLPEPCRDRGAGGASAADGAGIAAARGGVRRRCPPWQRHSSYLLGTRRCVRGLDPRRPARVLSLHGRSRA